MIKEFPDMSLVQIKSITSPVHGMAAVAIDPPYREFPNVVLFRYDEGVKRWQRILEGLSLGVQPQVSRVLDLHTIGIGLDFKTPTEEDQRRYLSDLSVGLGWAAVPYRKFVHVHPSGRETYYLDKRDTSSIAERLAPIGHRYIDTECTLFDVPELTEVSLSHDSGRFKLRAGTVNDQEWTVTFTSVDGSGHLNQKVILADAKNRNRSD